MKKRLRKLEERVAALEERSEWTPRPRPDTISEPVDAQTLIREMSTEWGNCYDQWGDDDEWGYGVYL